MIEVYFSPDITGKLEKEICAWIREHAEFGDTAFTIKFDDEELALYFKLKFGL